MTSFCFASIEHAKLDRAFSSLKQGHIYLKAITRLIFSSLKEDSHYSSEYIIQNILVVSQKKIAVPGAGLAQSLIVLLRSILVFIILYFHMDISTTCVGVPAYLSGYIAIYPSIYPDI